MSDVANDARDTADWLVARARRENLSVPTDRHNDDACLHVDADLSPAMVRRLERARAEEKAAGSDPLVDDPSIDLDMYRRVMRLRMGTYAMARRRIYLDLNYWIWL